MPIFVWLRKDELNLSRNQGRVLPKLHCHKQNYKSQEKALFEVNVTIRKEKTTKVQSIKKRNVKNY